MPVYNPIKNRIQMPHKYINSVLVGSLLDVIRQLLRQDI